MDAIFIMLKFEGLSHAVEVKVWEYKYREAFDCDSLRSSAARLPWTPCVEESKRQGTAVNVPILHRSQSCPGESRLVAAAVRENNDPGGRPGGPDGELPVSAPTWPDTAGSGGGAPAPEPQTGRVRRVRSAAACTATTLAPPLAAAASPLPFVFPPSRRSFLHGCPFF